MASLYTGISGLPLDEDEFDLGGGIKIRKTYVHLMMPMMLAFAPASEGKPHPAPWVPVADGTNRSHDIVAEMYITDTKEGDLEKCHVFSSLLRLWSNPATTMVAAAAVPLASLTSDGSSLVLIEIQKRSIPYYVREGGSLTSSGASWIKMNGPIAYELWNKSAEFKLALDALNGAQYQRNTALILVSLWAAFEALFVGDRNELRFRVSSYMAAYLEPYGPDRLAKQQEIAKLYDKRSAAVHGVPSHDPEDVVKTLNLMRDVLIAIMLAGSVPNRETLNKALLGELSPGSNREDLPIG
jgi:hypothetical protein